VNGQLLNVDLDKPQAVVDFPRTSTVRKIRTFQDLKCCPISVRNFDLLFKLATDAWKIGLGALYRWILQRGKSYCVRPSLMAIKKFRTYVECFSDPFSRLGGWAHRLQEYNFEVEYRKVKAQYVLDALPSNTH
ncbi:hypothetical protein HHI36_004713, partial [Cryptolaemus montrouzieri]